MSPTYSCLSRISVTVCEHHLCRPQATDAHLEYPLHHLRCRFIHNSFIFVLRVFPNKTYFICSTHRMYGEKCGAHFIRAVVLEELVWAHIKMIISYVTCHEAHFRAVMEQRMKLTSEDAVQLRKKRLKKAEKRIKELDQMFIRLYEDNVKGCISDERFSMMS